MESCAKGHRRLVFGCQACIEKAAEGAASDRRGGNTGDTFSTQFSRESQVSGAKTSKTSKNLEKLKARLAEDRAFAGITVAREWRKT